MTRPYKHALVPVEWLPHHIGRRIYLAPEGVGAPDWLELVHVDLVDNPTGKPSHEYHRMGYRCRGWVRHLGRVLPGTLPMLCFMRDVPQNECAEHYIDGDFCDWDWQPPSDEPPLHEWYVHPKNWTPPIEERLTIAPLSDDGALFTL